MSDPFLGEIKMFASNFAPKGWALCNGQLLPINQNQALFSILGITYGGNGTTNFALPDLRGRSPVNPDDSTVTLGQAGGVEAVTLTSAQGRHGVGVDTGATTSVPTGALPARGGAYNDAVDGVTGNAGGQPHPNLAPYLVINYCIALQGIFPSRN